MTVLARRLVTAARALLWLAVAGHCANAVAVAAYAPLAWAAWRPGVAGRPVGGRGAQGRVR